MTLKLADSPMRTAARRFADRTALVGASRRWTFDEFDSAVDRLAGGLAAQLTVGDRVALYMRNAAEYLLLQTAIERAGLVRVPLNVRYTPLEVANLLTDCEAGLVVHDKHTEAAAEEAVARTDRPIRMLAIDGRVYAEWLAGAPIEADRSAADIDALASITYTSGTSGRPKGVMLSHRNWRGVTRNMLIDRRIRGTDRLAHVGPLTHAAGTYFAPFFLSGATSVVVGEGTVEALLAAIERHRITGFTCVPSLLTRIVNHPDIDRFDLSSLEFIFYGAESIPLNTLEKALRCFGPILTQNYGLTEAMMTCAYLPPEDHFDHGGELRSGCIGRPYSFVDMVLRGADGAPVATGEVGEITVRSEHMMQGYWRMPEETRKVLRDGWLWSGDLARADSDGFITLAGRSKDVIISGGFNIYPQEVEACLTGSPGIVEAAVVGVANEDFGEMAVAFVVPAESETIDVEALSSWCKPRLGIKTPKRWRIVPELPRSSNGKIDKAAIRRIAEEFDWR
jgi:acyl-CoA synthetase (AMP-forming)/AMP-acid ligase II